MGLLSWWRKRRERNDRIAKAIEADTPLPPQSWPRVSEEVRAQLEYHRAMRLRTRTRAVSPRAPVPHRTDTIVMDNTKADVYDTSDLTTAIASAAVISALSQDHAPPAYSAPEPVPSIPDATPCAPVDTYSAQPDTSSVCTVDSTPSPSIDFNN
jgi:hypothetical protein